jgi:hypothetical protein
MGGFLPTAAMSAVQMGLAAAQQSRQAEHMRAAQAADARAQINQIRLANDIDARRRQEQLRRALASQRARFGAQGVATGGSADAVLHGLAAESQRRDEDSRALAQQRIAGINQDIEWSDRRSLLNSYQPVYRGSLSLLQQGIRAIPLLDF